LGDQSIDPVSAANSVAWQGLLVLSLVGKAASMVRKYKRPEHYDDLFQEGVIACNTAITKFEPGRGSKLASLAHQYIRTGLKRYLDRDAPFTWEHKNRVPGRGVVHDYVARRVCDGEELDQDWVDPEPNPLDKLMASDQDTALQAAMVNGFCVFLNARERDVIERGMRGETLFQIGSALGVSDERIRQIRDRALGKLGQMDRSAPALDLSEPIDNLMFAGGCGRGRARSAPQDLDDGVTPDDVSLAAPAEPTILSMKFGPPKRHARAQAASPVRIIAVTPSLATAYLAMLERKIRGAALLKLPGKTYPRWSTISTQHSAWRAAGARDKKTYDAEVRARELPNGVVDLSVWRLSAVKKPAKPLKGCHDIRVAAGQRETLVSWFARHP
jgi:RNA polymerase sigma factor (sigma-70 family)